jgi:hypothetical protein
MLNGFEPLSASSAAGTCLLRFFPWATFVGSTVWPASPAPFSGPDRNVLFIGITFFLLESSLQIEPESKFSSSSSRPPPVKVPAGPKPATEYF